MIEAQWPLCIQKHFFKILHTSPQFFFAVRTFGFRKRKKKKNATEAPPDVLSENETQGEILSQ